MIVTLRIVESPGNTLVGEIPSYTGPVPRPGEYIYHPSLNPADTPSNVMSVKTVTYDLLTREPDFDHFVSRTDRYVVEVHV